MSWFTHRDPFQSFFNSGYADDDSSAWPFSNEYARRNLHAPTSQQQLAAQRAAQRQRMLEEQEQQRALEQQQQQRMLQQERQRRLLEQQQQQRQQYAGHPYMMRSGQYPYGRHAAPPAARSPLYEQHPYARHHSQQDMEDDENYFHSYLDRDPFMKRMPQRQSYQRQRSPFEVLLEDNQLSKPPVLEEIPAPKKKSPAKKLRGTSTGQKRKMKKRVAPAPQDTVVEQEHHLDVPQPIRSEDVSVPRKVARKSASPNHLRASRRIPIMDENSPSPAERARQMHHHEPAFSLRRMAEEDQQKELRDHAGQHHHDEMRDSTQDSEAVMEEAHAPSAADRLRNILADQTAVEEEHHKHDTLPEELPLTEQPQASSSEDEDSMEEEQEAEAAQHPTTPAMQQGMTLEDIQTISQIRELNKQAQSYKIPSLAEVTRLRDLLEPEELLTQTLLRLDNLTVSDFSRPFRKQVIQFIQQQLKKIDELKTVYKQQNPNL